MASASAPTTTALPLRAAAARLGLSTDTLRKRLQRGLTPGRKVDGSWVVDVPVVRDRPRDRPQDGPGPVRDAPGPVPDPSAPVQDHQNGAAPPGALTAAARAEEMAVYTERLLAPWRAIVQAQAEEIGSLKAQLAAATSTNGVVHDPAGVAVGSHSDSPPETESAPPAGAPAGVQGGPASRVGRGRRWWHRVGAWLR